MKYRRTALASLGYELAPNVISSAALEAKLAPLYQALKIKPGQIEALTGIRERRFWDPGFSMAEGALKAARHALQQANVPASALGALVYTGVCRDGFEPATACRVAEGLGLGGPTTVLDLSNACLGALNACLMVGNMIELGQIEAGLVVSCESAREITEATIERMLKLGTMDCLKLSMATLTGGSGAVAMLLVDSESGLSGERHRLAGGVLRAAPEYNRLCTWGPEKANGGHVIMETDAAEVMKNGIALGSQTWVDFLRELDWAADDVSKVICHQVGGGHRGAMLASLGVATDRDFCTYEYFGNCGTVALPLTAAIAQERGFLQPGDRVGFLGIGSGLNCLMLGWEW